MAEVRSAAEQGMAPSTSGGGGGLSSLALTGPSLQPPSLPAHFSQPVTFYLCLSFCVLAMGLSLLSQYLLDDLYILAPSLPHAGEQVLPYVSCMELSPYVLALCDKFAQPCQLACTYLYGCNSLPYIACPILQYSN